MRLCSPAAPPRGGTARRRLRRRRRCRRANLPSAPRPPCERHRTQNHAHERPSPQTHPSSRMVRKEPDLSNVAKRLTNKRQQCADEIRSLMECMAVRFCGSRLPALPVPRGGPSWRRPPTDEARVRATAPFFRAEKRAHPRGARRRSAEPERVPPSRRRLCLTIPPPHHQKPSLPTIEDGHGRVGLCVQQAARRGRPVHVKLGAFLLFCRPRIQASSRGRRPAVSPRRCR
jgi:hypothetical protein